MKKLETTIKEGDYARADDVEIEIVESMPQPDIVVKNSYRVKEIKHDIADLTKDIAEKTARKQMLEKLLEDKKNDINNAVKK